VNTRTWVTHGGSGLLEPFTVPELTIDAAISRGWELVDGLMEPRPPAYLCTFPPDPRLILNWYWGHQPVSTGPFIRGLPEL
jgi:hypothetical protein